MDDALELLKAAREVLSHYWFGDDGEGDEYNNDDVIEISERIDRFLEGVAEAGG